MSAFLGGGSSGGVSGVSSVANSDGLLDVAPNTGDVVVNVDPGFYLVNKNSSNYSYFLGGSGNSTASSVVGGNFGFGADALADLTSGQNNFGIGVSAMQDITSGSDNIAIGRFALFGTTTESRNVAIGAFAAENSTGAQTFVSIGYQGDPTAGPAAPNLGVSIGGFALYSCVGTYDVGIGYGSMSNLSGGSGNVGIGANVALNIVSGSNNTWIGAFCTPASDVSGTIGIGTGDGTTQIDYNATQATTWTIRSGVNLRLGVAYTAGAPTATGYLTLYDSTGTRYRIPAVAG
jgi:hypothetical protein